MTLEIRSDVLSSNRIRVLIEELDMETLNHAEWPSDLHLVEYELNGTTYAAGVRAHSKTDIFDCYFDHLHPLGGKVVTIRSGLGTIKPKLWTGK